MGGEDTTFISPNIAFRLRALAKQARERVARRKRNARLLLHPDSSLLVPLYLWKRDHHMLSDIMASLQHFADRLDAI
eukprot:766421-Hanusia_phi.AAC.3